MEFTGERMVPGHSGQELEEEHWNRYYFASQFVRGKRMLDAACGTGYGTELLSRIAQEAVGIDISEDAVAYAGQNYRADNLKYLAASVTKLPFSDNCFDVVVSYETLEHIDATSQKVFLHEIRRVLKPDGILVMSTPNKNIYDCRGENAFHRHELGYTEFADLLSEQFQHIQLLSQKWEICDAIVREGGAAALVRNGLRTHDAEYLIAVCSNAALPDVQDQVYVREDEKLSAIMKWATENDLRNAKSNEHIRALDAEIAEYRKQADAQRAQIETQTRELSAREAQLEKLIFGEAELWALIHKYEQGLEQKEQAVRERETELNSRNNQIETLLQKQRELEEMARNQEACLQNREDEIAQLLRARQEEAVKQEALQASANEKEKAIAEGQRQIQEREGHIELLLQSERELKGTLEETRTQLHNKEGHIELLLETDRELERIKASRSWRFMTFVWFVRDLLIPKDSRRRLFFKLLGKLFQHPLRFVRKCTPGRIKKLFYYLRREGADSVSRRLNECLVSEQLLSRMLDISVPVPESTADREAGQTEAENGSQENTHDYAQFEIPDWEQPLVSIVIPVYNQFAYTYLCVKSVYEHSGDVSYEILIADDCSTDLTKQIDGIIHGLHTIHNSQNLRFLRNCNHAAKSARGKYILFLNNDTQVQEGWLKPLVELIESREDIGMVGSKLVYPDGKLQEAGGIVWRDASAWNYGRLSDPDFPEYNYVKEVDYISGAAIMIKRQLWEKIGGFDEQFAPAYCEDSDLAFEVRRNGYKVLYQPKSVVVHFEGISNGTDTASGQKTYQTINQKKFYEKWKEELEGHFPNGVDPFVARERGKGKKYLLMVDHYVPQFDKDAGSQSVYQYLKLFVDEGYQVKFIGDNFFPHQPYTEVLQQMGIEVLYGPYYAEHWIDWLKENGNNIRYAFLNRPHIAVKYIDAVRQYSSAKIVYYGHDLHFMRTYREYELTKDAVYLKEAEEWKSRELSLMRKADMAYYPSPVEEAEIHRVAPDASVKAIPGYLFSNFPEPNYHASSRKDMLFIGGFGHSPNVDAVKWLAEEIMPRLEKDLPELVVYVLGSNPPKVIKQLESDHLRIVGYVTDEQLAAYYSACRMVLVPLRYGAGIKGKVVEAMRCGVPVVTTGIGAEGISDAETILAIVDDAEAFAKEAARLYGAFSELEERSKLSVAYIARRFSPENAKIVIRPEFDME